MAASQRYPCNDTVTGKSKTTTVCARNFWKLVAFLSEVVSTRNKTKKLRLRHGSSMRLQQKTADDFLLPEASAFLHVCFFNFLPTCDTDARVCLVLQLPACPIADCARGERACITIILMLTDLEVAKSVRAQFGRESAWNTACTITFQIKRNPDFWSGECLK